jgi:hypothetical protein
MPVPLGLGLKALLGTMYRAPAGDASVYLLCDWDRVVQQLLRGCVGLHDAE